MEPDVTLTIKINAHVMRVLKKHFNGGSDYHIIERVVRDAYMKASEAQCFVEAEPVEAALAAFEKGEGE